MRKLIFKNVAGRIVRIPCDSNSDIRQWRWSSSDDTRRMYLTLRRDNFSGNNKLQGLRFDAERYHSEGSGDVLIFQGKTHIPLSITAFYRYIVLPKTKAYKQAISRLSVPDIEV